MFSSKHMQYLQRLAVRSLKSSRTATPEQLKAGLTLLECLVAIAVTGLVVSTITPAVIISVATRIQNQKAEQAVKVAQSEIDRVRSLVEQGNTDPALLPQSTTVTRTKPSGQLYFIEYPQSVLGPVASSALKASNVAYSGLGPFDAKGVDVDGDGVVDLAIQVYRSPGQLNGSTPVNFSMGVRVYDVKAFSNGQTGNLSASTARAGVAGNEGERGRKPLAVLYTTIAKGDNATSYCDYVKYQGSTPSSNFKCN